MPQGSQIQSAWGILGYYSRGAWGLLRSQAASPPTNLVEPFRAFWLNSVTTTTLKIQGLRTGGMLTTNGLKTGGRM